VTTKCPISKDPEAYYRTSGVWHFLFNSSSPNYETLQLLPDQPPDYGCEFGPLQQSPTLNTFGRPEYRKVVESDWQASSRATDDAILPEIPTILDMLATEFVPKKT